MSPHRTLALLAASLSLGCEAPTTELPPGAPGNDDGVSIELGDEVLCEAPVANDQPIPYSDITDAATMRYATATPTWDGSQNGYSSVDIELAGGMVAADLDGDGNLDLLITDHGEPARLFLGNGDGDFSQVSAAARGIDTSGAYLVGASAADINGDDRPDLYLLASEGNLLFINEGEGTFSERAEEYGLVGGERRSATAAWADVDHDGDLDVLVVNHGRGSTAQHMSDPPQEDQFFVREGDLFDDRIDRIYPAVDRDGYGFAAGWFDADDDGLLDLYIVNDLAAVGNGNPPNYFAHNLGLDEGGEPVFEEGTESHLSMPMLAMGLAVGDLDGDSDLDLHVSNAGRTFLARNDGDLLFTDISLSLAEHSEGPRGDISWSTEFFDQDNDGQLELFCAFGHMPTKTGGHHPNGTVNAEQQHDALWQRNEDGESFEDIATSVGIDSPLSTRTVIAADFDRNGFLDVVTWAIHDGPRLYQAACSERSWLLVHLDMPGTLNRDAIGARVEAWANGEPLALREMTAGSTGAMTAGPPEVHLGLGLHDQVELRVRWPNGRETVHPDIPTRREVRLVMAEGP